MTLGGKLMIDPYDPRHPDGPADTEDLPPPLAQTPWLDDADYVDDWRSDFSLVTEDPE